MSYLKNGDVKTVGSKTYTCNGGTTKVTEHGQAIKHESTNRSNLRINQGK